MNNKIFNGMNYLEKFFRKAILVIFMLVSPVLIFAATTTIENPLTKANTINELIKTILEGVIKIGMPIIALAVVYCGFLFVQARGNPEAIKKAKDSLLYTLIGAAILLGSWAIAQLISSTVLAL